MSIYDAQRLLDITTRLQLYVEGVKQEQAKQFNNVMFDLNAELKKLLNNISYKTLDGLTKAQLNKLIVSVRSVQREIYSTYTQNVLDQLEAFSNVALEVNQIMYASELFNIKLTSITENQSYDELVSEAEKNNIKGLPIFKKDEYQVLNQTQAILLLTLIANRKIIPLFGISAITTNDAAKLWAKIQSEPIPANGIYIEPFVNGFGVVAQSTVENAIRKAYANGETVEDLRDEFFGNSETGITQQGKSSIINKIENANKSVIDTAVQHVCQNISAAVSSIISNLYVWLSVIDSKTSDICRGRNLQVYEYGKGPLPPAHEHCRSHTAPIMGTQEELPAISFFTWLDRQPSIIQDDILGETDAERLRAGKLQANELAKFRSRTPLTLSEFSDKIEKILL